MLYDEQTQLSSRRVAGNGALPSKQESPAHVYGGTFHPSLKGRASREIKWKATETHRNTSVLTRLDSAARDGARAIFFTAEILDSKIYSARLFIFHVCLFVSLVKTIPSQLSIQRLPCLHRDDLLDKSSIWAFGAQSRAMPGFNYSESS